MSAGAKATEQGPEVMKKKSQDSYVLINRADDGGFLPFSPPPIWKKSEMGIL